MFMDFDKAFDSLYHIKMWPALAEQDILKKVVKILAY